MNCHQVTRRMSAYVDGELTGMEMLEIRRHLHDCGRCREEFESIRSVKFLVSRLNTVDPRPGFAAALSMKLDEIQVPVYQRAFNSFIRTFKGRMTPVTTAFVAVAAALVVLSARSIDQMGPVQPLSTAQSPSLAVHGFENVSASVLPARDDAAWSIRRSENVYRTSMPVSMPEGGFLTVSFGH